MVLYHKMLCVIMLRNASTGGLTMEHISIITLISLSATFLGCFFLLYREIKGMEDRTFYQIEQQSARTDKLYEIIIDLLKEKK